ncbi:MAG: hypothetical protein NC131_12795 [Roseburia sp.]|nr:hypothetical protein [Roseburia sp.]
MADEKRNNMLAVERVVDAYSDHTAEVVNVFVKGRHRVETFRRLSPGDEVRLVAGKDNVALYALDVFICNLLLPDSSRILSLLKEGVPVEAFLGGRDIEQSYNEDADFASIIIFYKIDGVPPTKVILN